VDGGTRSATNVDLLAGQGLDELYVLAPMAARRRDRPRGVLARIDRQYRRTVTRMLLQEARLVSGTGTRVRLLAPDLADLAEMGGNMMDPARRPAVLETAMRTCREALRPVSSGG
jgi:NTE family protein